MDSRDIWSVVREAEVIILAERLETDLVQNMVVKTAGKIYYYSPEAGCPEDYISFGRLIPFGRNEEKFTDANIRRRKLLADAIALNRQYAEKYGTEKNWGALSEFTKSSNISSADYMTVLADLKGMVGRDELAELEHIRWCRLHFLNYWQYGEAKDGAKRLHPDLVPFGELERTERKKDYAAVDSAGE